MIILFLLIWNDLERREELQIVDYFMVEIRWVDSMHSKIRVRSYTALSPRMMQPGELNQTISNKITRIQIDLIAILPLPITPNFPLKTQLPHLIYFEFVSLPPPKKTRQHNSFRIILEPKSSPLSGSLPLVDRSAVAAAFASPPSTWLARGPGSDVGCR